VAGKVSLGYDFYGNVTKPNGKRVTVVANTAMVAEQFWIRGVHIDTRVQNDEEAQNPNNVVTTGLEGSDHSIRVYTGAGDNLLQIPDCSAMHGRELLLGSTGHGNQYLVISRFGPRQS